MCRIYVCWPLTPMALSMSLAALSCWPHWRDFGKLWRSLHRKTQQAAPLIDHKSDNATIDGWGRQQREGWERKHLFQPSYLINRLLHRPRLMYVGEQKHPGAVRWRAAVDAGADSGITIHDGGQRWRSYGLTRWIPLSTTSAGAVSVPLSHSAPAAAAAAFASSTALPVRPSHHAQGLWILKIAVRAEPRSVAIG